MIKQHKWIGFGAVALGSTTGYSGKEQNLWDVAGYLAMGTGSAVCRQVRRLRVRMGEDASLAAQVKDAESKLVPADCST